MGVRGWTPADAADLYHRPRTEAELGHRDTIPNLEVEIAVPANLKCTAFLKLAPSRDVMGGQRGGFAGSTRHPATSELRDLMRAQLGLFAE